MKMTVAYIILIISIFGCINNKKIEETKFDLNKEILDFSAKIVNGDTLIILADLSACTSWWIEKNTLIKNEDIITISTHAQGEFVDQTKLDKVEYNCTENDSLNFENLFQFMTNKGTNDRGTNSNVITVIYKQDTIRYFSDGLNDHLKNIGYYILIKRRIFPDVEMYQPVETPPKPEDNKLDSLIELDKEKMLNNLNNR
ncbi:hypothetical protein [uncultured Draconibacterium sp.]|uniref:hypothetical protein n=1 Tax=uncultured Draconibacterium sp. TaxID=1573823 RepID=UPI0032170398